MEVVLDYIKNNPDSSIEELVKNTGKGKRQLSTILHELLECKEITMKHAGKKNYYSAIDESIKMLNRIPKGKLSLREVTEMKTKRK